MVAPNDFIGRRVRRRASHIHPVLRELFEEMDRRKMTYREAETLSGVPSNMMTYWNGGHCNPSVLTISYLAEALGYRLSLEKIEK